MSHSPPIAQLAHSPASALHRLLAEVGVRTTPQAIRDALGSEAHASALARSLEHFGQKARAVRVSPEDLRELSLPALVMLRRGGAWVVSEADGTSVTLDGPQGEQRRVRLAELATHAENMAVEIVGTLPLGPSFERRVMRLLFAHKRALVRLLLTALVLMGLGALAPMVTRAALDRALPENARSLLAALAFASLLLTAHRAWIGWLRDRVVRSLDAQLQTISQRAIFEHLLGLSLSDLQRHPMGRLVQAQQTAEAAVSLLVQSGLSPVLDGILALGYWGLLTWELPLAGLSMLLLFVVVLLGVALFASRHARLHGEEVELGARQQGELFELLSGAATIKAAGAERAAVEAWLGRLIDERTTSLARERNAIRLTSWLEAAQQLAMVGTFAWGGHACLVGELSLGGFLAVSMLADAFTRAMMGICSAWVPLWAVRSALTALDGLLRLETEALAPAQLALAPHQDDSVILDDVWFRYGPDQPWILKGYNLRVAMGETLELRGASGTGKTTILRLIAGLCSPERGTVAVMGVNPARVRTKAAYLPQEAHLFAGSILANLQLLSGGAAWPAIEHAARTTGLATWVESLPMQYETVLSPGGTTLSGGQRQLVVLTAALASDATLLLLDEALAHVDHVQREALRRAEPFAGRTVVSVRHD